MALPSLDRLFIEALASGKLCLHPTDTLPGLACHPYQEAACRKLFATKERSSTKSCVALVASLDKACSYWRPLPKPWRQILQKIWPAPLSVVFTAHTQMPTSLCFPDRTLALRVPRMAESAKWMVDVLAQLEFPLPTTSVNASGEPPANSWLQALRYAKSHADIFVPECKKLLPESSFIGQGSTIIRIEEDASFTCLREGSFSLARLNQVVAEVR